MFKIDVCITLDPNWAKILDPDQNFNVFGSTTMQGAMAHLRDDFSWRVYYIWGAKIFGTETRSQLTMSLLCTQQTSTPYTVRKEIKCSGDSEILREIARDTTRIKSCRSDFRVVSRPISFSISEFPLHFISFLTVRMSWIPPPHTISEALLYCSVYTIAWFILLNR